MTTRRGFGTMVGTLALLASILVANTGATAAQTKTRVATACPPPAFRFSPSCSQVIPSPSCSINDHSVIAGYHGDGLTPQTPSKGFVLTLPNHFVLENYPRSAQTQVIAINNAGETGGFYIDTAGVTHGFLDITGQFLRIDYPGTTFNQILGLNGDGDAAGYYLDASGRFHPYIRLANGTFRLVPVPNAQATGINDKGQISGFAMSSPTTAYGFVLQGRTLTTIKFPGSSFTQALGLNFDGHVVGSYTDSAGFIHGFLYINGSFEKIDYPRAALTVVNGINENGRIVGFYCPTLSDCPSKTFTTHSVGFVGTPS